MAATITDIAAEAQISLGLAYRYFADKDAIFSALIKQTVPAEAWNSEAFGDAWDAWGTSCRVLSTW
jgi:AcrR family transcriptional regulator